MRIHPLHLLICSLFIVIPIVARADDPQSTEARLRDALRSAVQQLRSAQDQLATAQAAQAESDRQLAVCKDQVTSLTTDLKNLKDKSEADHEADMQTIEQMKEQISMQQRVIEDRERKNFELYTTAMEVLTRYEKFGLGEAIEAKEPFLGLTRVKLENQVQDYEDKFVNNKTYPGQPPSPEPTAATPTTPPADSNSQAKPASDTKSSDSPADSGTKPVAPSDTSLTPTTVKVTKAGATIGTKPVVETKSTSPAPVVTKKSVKKSGNSTSPDNKKDATATPDTTTVPTTAPAAAVASPAPTSAPAPVTPDPTTPPAPSTGTTPTDNGVSKP